MTKSFVSFFLLLLLSACGLIYHPDIQQGNILEPSALKQLKLGMTEEQVRYLMGNNVLQSPFHTNRLDYVYFRQPRKAKVTQQYVTLIFSDHKLVKIQQKLSD